MTEAEWLAGANPEPMLEFLRDSGNDDDRKVRLFCCGCCRGIWSLLPEEQCRPAVVLSEDYADGVAKRNAVRTMVKHFKVVYDQTFRDFNSRDRATASAAQRRCLCLAAVWSALQIPVRPESVMAKVGHLVREERLTQPTAETHAQLLRDIFGNPFRPVSLDPSWRTSTVLALASGIYQERAFDRMPILADALEDAGCDNNDILNHCRQPAEHARGCWVMDAILLEEE